MRAAITAIAVAVAVVATSTPAHATRWITVGPYPTEQSCLVDKQRYNQLHPAWGCYQGSGGWYFQYNRGF